MFANSAFAQIEFLPIINIAPALFSHTNKFYSFVVQEQISHYQSPGALVYNQLIHYDDVFVKIAMRKKIRQGRI